MPFLPGHLLWQPRLATCCLDAFIGGCCNPLTALIGCMGTSLSSCLSCFPVSILRENKDCLHNERPTSFPLSNFQVKLLEVMEGMDKETFEFKFGKELTFTTVLSDQQVVELIPGGAGIVVGYEDRSRFIQLVQKTRLEESKEQVPPRGQQNKSFVQLLTRRA